jgi:hypothetical protein
MHLFRSFRRKRAVRRIQDVSETREELAYARELGFGGINFDFICGLPLQTPASWQRTMDLVAEMRPDRIAVYSFAFVPDARPHQRKLSAPPMAAGRDKLVLRRIADDTLSAVGYRAIGMDHFALPGDELAEAQEYRGLRRNFQGYTCSSFPCLSAASRLQAKRARMMRGAYLSVRTMARAGRRMMPTGAAPRRFRDRRLSRLPTRIRNLGFHREQAAAQRNQKSFVFRVAEPIAGVLGHLVAESRCAALARSNRTASVRVLLGSRTQQPIGQTTAHCGMWKKPTHSVHKSASIT